MEVQPPEQSYWLLDVHAQGKTGIETQNLHHSPSGFVGWHR